MLTKKTFYLFSILYIQISTLNAHKSIYTQISEQYINSFQPKAEKKDLLEALNLTTGKIDKIKLHQILQKKFIEPRKYTEITLKLLNSSSNKEFTQNKTKTSKKLFNNLELLCGEHEASKNLLSKIDRTQTFAGRINLISMLMQPTTDIEKLNERQQIIIELYKNKEIFENLNKVIQKYKKVEKEILSFFEERTFNKLFGSENYFPNMFWIFNLLIDILPADKLEELEIEKMSDSINQNDFLLSIFNLIGTTLKGVTIKTTVNKGIIIDYKMAEKELLKNKAKNIPLFILQLLFGGNIGKFQAGRIFDDFRGIYQQIKQEVKNYKQLKIAHKKLQKIATLLSSIKNINNIIKNDNILNDKIKSFESINYFLNNKASESKLFDTVLKNLELSTLKDENAPFIYLLALKGKILSSAYLLAKTQRYLVDYIKSIGEIDAYLSITQLYKESLKQNAKYCFAEYENSTQSHIKIENFWTPFINPNTVITNSIELGGKNTAKCALISGPNAGGKSTILKSIIINTLFAQTITITPANSCIITPFSYIDTYLNITDDISGGNSLFKSEVIRVKNLIEKIKTSGKSLIIVDEMFNGTNPREGEASSYAIAEYIAQISLKKEEVIALIASHYKEMTNLETNTANIFKNYKVSVYKDKNTHKLNYPFTLQIGESDQDIAIDILQSEGLSKKIIDSARKIAYRATLS